MFDFWHALGAAVVKPAILNNLNGVNVFTLVPRVKFSEFDVNGNPVYDPANRDQTVLGTVDPQNTKTLRGALQADMIGGPFQTPVCLSLHVAAKFAQMDAVPSFQLRNVINSCNGSLRTSATARGLNLGNPLTVHFVALLGLLLVDSDIRGFLTGNPGTLFNEFPVSATEKQVLTDLATDHAFSGASTTFTTGGVTPTSNGNWDHCGNVRTGIYANAARILY